ncbi:MAG: sigma-54-dependent Fis family transcriptional regulator [Calditrichaeota bacterium]|nr:MAG: sigma-54-dependent Fis family transcriptional regulator [Calditrichota bacterium]
MLKIKKIRILLIEDEDYDVRRVRNTLNPFKEKLVIKDVVSDGLSALQRLRNGTSYDVIIMDFQISGGLRGEKLIREIKNIDPALQIIVITKMTMNMTDFDFANNLLDAGAIWYCTKYPGDIEEYIYQPTDFILNILNAFERKRLYKARQHADSKLQKNIENLLHEKKIIGDSSAMRQLRLQIENYAVTDANVLVLGPSGTGKELVAANMHYKSLRSTENFIPINCGSLPDHLVESELFGFEKGSFTGAADGKDGLFEIANGGTIFLDEIAELPLAVQSKLLRVIQEGEIDKIGRAEKIKVNVRIIAATNKNLHEEVREKRFRQDLYYRLNVVSLVVPPLTKRKDDIPRLMHHFLWLYGQSMNLTPPEIDDDAMESLVQYGWPGNVRELQNVAQRLLFGRSRRIDLAAIRTALGFQDMTQGEWGEPAIASWHKDRIKPWRELELEIQEKYFRFVRENTSSDADAARQLGLAPSNYHRMCKKLGLK